MKNIIEVEGVKYRKVKRKAEVGELVEVFGHMSEANGVVTVDKVEHDGHIHYGIYGRLPGGYFVLEPETAPEVTDLLANLALRVSELEKPSTSANGKLLRIHTGTDVEGDFLTHITVGIDEATGVMYVLGMKTEVSE